ncbi:alpha-1,2-fucosyltransferase [Polaribacter sp. 20A6]|uniref:alpha-1,2-fucosyltransferase n=1 Tax=Polaribacter sp. 20A6 TaxID=2687289 RepID=UPI0013FDD425|nr:alpha-1,2-fucosyltransferase [Polaribacter sp. 20A6]
MIIINLKGGLGNQMFQFAVASIVAEKSKQLVKIDNTYYDNVAIGATPRNYELSIFDKFFKIASEGERKKFLKNSYLKKIKKKIGVKYARVYKEPSLNYQPKLLCLNGPIYLEGYFQSYKYLMGWEDYIRKLYSFPIEDLGMKNKSFLKKITGSENSVGIHIRRGDYVSEKKFKDFHGICTKEYYLKAIEYFTNTYKNVTFVFFSDEIDWCEREFSDIGFSTIFVKDNSGVDSWNDLFLMSSCNHNIIANSSFSWWGAWLNNNSKKQVIAPRNWYANEEANKSSNDIIPESWIRL